MRRGVSPTVAGIAAFIIGLIVGAVVMYAIAGMGAAGGVAREEYEKLLKENEKLKAKIEELSKKLQAAGKNLHIAIGIDEVETALAELSARGLFIHTWAASEDEARELLKKAEKWSKPR